MSFSELLQIFGVYLAGDKISALYPFTDNILIDDLSLEEEYITSRNQR